VSGMKRRQVLGWLNWFAMGSGLSAFLASCGGSNKGGFDQFVRLDVLDESGSILKDYFAKDPIIVVRDPKDKNTVHAVNALCTHQGCLVNWNKDKQVFICPCHGSSFAADGKYLQGPANKALDTFPAKIEGPNVLVKA
jgi:cytochrome b6-f complex iron-sulfur subunit